MTDDIDKITYYVISLYNLKKLLELPEEICDMISNLKQTDPNKYDYSKFDKFTKSWNRINDLMKM